MSDRKSLAFTTNSNKDYLRSTYDRDIVKTWSERLGVRLQYLGLPGPDILDIVEWQDFIDRFSTIERLENEQHLIFLRANVRDMEHRLHSLYGTFDDILLAGRDRYGQTPRWPYDLVNLDFFGGLLYSDLDRPKALAKLIENQKTYGKSFLLIITYHLRDADLAKEKLAFLEDLQRKLNRNFGIRAEFADVIGWYKNSGTPDAARQSLYLNTFLLETGEASYFRVVCRSPIVYGGTGGAQMIHFVTEFHYQQGAHRGVSEQSLIDVINLGYTALKAGRVSEPISIPRLSEIRPG
ncbi:MAG: hypothetical protein M3P26_06740 [Gemmatimonadota bacterium]|nr:hypothetical protein [Gemmatimonadota bacterium]